jgi:zinc protease
MRQIIVYLVTASMSTAAAQEGQQMQSMKGVTLKNRAPVSNDVLRVRLPRPVEGKLANGLGVMVLEDRRLPTVFVELLLPASALNDPPGIPGLADATADLVRLGTRTKDSRQLAEHLADIGVSLSTSAEFGAPYSSITLSGLSDKLDAMLAVLREVLLEPSFPQVELEKWRQRQMSFLQQARTSPNYLATERFHKLLYPDARAVTASTVESLSKITRDSIAAFHAANYVPGGALIGIAGDVRAKDIMARLQKNLSGWKTAAVKAPNLPQLPPLADKKIVLINRPGSVQSFLMVGNRALNRMNADYIPATVMNKVLGQGPAARLFRNIREEKGYTYGISSSFTAQRFKQHFSSATSVRTEVTGPALEELLKEFSDIRDRAIPADELANARRALVANFALGLESPSNMLRQAMTLKEYGLPASYWDEYPAKVMAVTAETAQKMARAYVPVANAQIVVVGDAAKIRDVLARFGTVEEVQAE